MENRSVRHRYVILGVFLAGFMVFFVSVLFKLQILNGQAYREQITNQTERSYPIKASRGEIFDTYGRPMVTNRMGYYIRIQDVGADDATLNDTIAVLLDIVEKHDVEFVDEFPIKGKPVDFYFEKDREKNIKEWKRENDFSDNDTPSKILDSLAEEYGILSKYTGELRRNIVAVRYEMEKKQFGITNPYTFATDVTIEVVHQVSERSFEMTGVSVEIEPVRQYVNGALAVHILGRTGLIYAEEYEKMKKDGYGMNDIIGKDGIEKELEGYLKGKDGSMVVQQNKKGSVEKVLSEVPPTTENYAVLTIDSKLQEVTETALMENIAAAREDKGYDAYSGAAIAVDVKTGGVLAIASYPSYDPEIYTESYDDMLKDETKPLFNRALGGAYTPGSTFKPLVAIAALEEGIISPTGTITCDGVYKYYAPSYQPTCLIWKSGGTHGPLNVSEAIGVSCNCFFYEAGRLVGIDNINKYAKAFGLGEETGIELYEELGIVAGPKYRERLNMEWYPGDVLQAAIGQSDNMFTPAQLVSYITTFLNKGTRKQLHIIKEIRAYETDEIVYEAEPEILSEMKIKDSTYEAVKDGMRRVTEDGTASAVFGDFPVAVGGKTGTAEVSRGSDNVLFVGFAPYDDPQIAVAVVIEHGASSRYAAKIGRAIFETYLGLGGVVDGVALPNRILR
ncbi:MAG: penicillin-binding protein 2 [Ruminococcaceae bacterium]|nr:penicillin-binding protein 2 [Oscillospiraceae bacterium]